MSGPQPSDPGPVFHWTPEKGRVWKLIPPLVLSSSVLAMLAIVFDVASPEPPRAPSMTRQLVHLDPSNSVANLALTRARDQSALILSALPPPAPDAGDLIPSFTPTFAGYRLEPKPLPGTDDQVPLPRLYSGADLALAPVPGRAPPSAVPDASSSAQIQPQWQSRSSGLELLSNADLSAVETTTLLESRLHVFVDPQGRVISVLPLQTGTALTDSNILHDLVAQWRFSKGDADAALRSGILGFRWTDDAANPS